MEKKPQGSDEHGCTDALLESADLRFHRAATVKATITVNTTQSNQ